MARRPTTSARLESGGRSQGSPGPISVTGAVRGEPACARVAGDAVADHGDRPAAHSPASLGRYRYRDARRALRLLAQRYQAAAAMIDTDSA